MRPAPAVAEAGAAVRSISRSCWASPGCARCACGGRRRHGAARTHRPARGIIAETRPTHVRCGALKCGGDMATEISGKSAERTKAGKWAAFGALGVVFGDLGTSPLYTLQTVVQASGGQFTPQSALGVLSLIFWTLIVTVSIKYCLFVMRADNRGEGGILALMSLIGANGFTPGFKLLTAMGLLGASLIYGDGVITPA